MTYRTMTLTDARMLLADVLTKDDLGSRRRNQALRLVLDTLDARTMALHDIVGPAAQALDDLGGLLDAGALSLGDPERADTTDANLDDLARAIGKADQALKE